MDYFEKAQELSNASVVDLYLIDELAEVVEDEDAVSPKDIVNLSRLVESFVFSDEVVVRNDAVIVDPAFDDYDFDFTRNIIELFTEKNVIQPAQYAASTFLSNSYYEFDPRSSQIAEEIDAWIQQGGNISSLDHTSEDDYNDIDLVTAEILFDDEIFDNAEHSESVWDKMTAFYGVPYVSCNSGISASHAYRTTNIAGDLYQRIETYYDDYFKKISKYLGPTYVRIPFILGLVLQECGSLEDLPNAIMEVRERFDKFIMETTEIEYQLRTQTSIFEQARILAQMENAYNNLAALYDTKIKTKNRVQSRVFDLTQSLIKSGKPLRKAAEEIVEMRIEENGLLLIPGYYDLWRASEDVEQALPLLKRLFGKRINNDFLQKLENMHQS